MGRGRKGGQNCPEVPNEKNKKSRNSNFHPTWFDGGGEMTLHVRSGPGDREDEEDARRTIYHAEMGRLGAKEAGGGGRVGKK